MEDALGLRFSEGFHAYFNLGISTGKNLSREQPSILCSTDRHRRHGNSTWHLDDGEQGIQPPEIFRRNRDADDGQMCFCCEHSGEMSGTTGSSDNDFDAARRGLLRICEQSVRSPMRRDNHQLIGNSELGENCDRFLKDGEIRLTSPQDSDQRLGPPLPSFSKLVATDGTSHRTKTSGSLDTYDRRRGLTIAVFRLTVKIVLAPSNSVFPFKN
jgi:hypothetical protein